MGRFIPPFIRVSRTAQEGTSKSARRPDDSQWVRAPSVRHLAAATQPVVEALEDRTLFGAGVQNTGNNPGVTIQCPCTTGGGTTDPGPTSIGVVPESTIAPVSYFNGRPEESAADLTSQGFGELWGQIRTWTGVNEGSQSGNGWSVRGLPYLILTLNQFAPEHGGFVQLVDGGDTSQKFEVPMVSGDNGTEFTTLYQGTSSLEYVPPTNDGTNDIPGEFKLTDGAGNVYMFYDLPRDTTGTITGTTYGRLYGEGTYAQKVTNQYSSTNYRFGAFISQTDPYGNTITASYDSNANLTAVTRTDSASGVEERLRYEYTTVTNDLVTAASGPAATLVSKVWLERRASSTADWEAVQSVDYNYYTGRKDSGGTEVGDPNGRLGDLKLATREDQTTVSGITRSGTTATATTAAPHDIHVGDQVTVSGVSQSDYDGTFTVTAVTATTFSYTVSGSPASPATAVSGLKMTAGQVTGRDYYRYYTVATASPYADGGPTNDPATTGGVLMSDNTGYDEPLTLLHVVVQDEAFDRLVAANSLDLTGDVPAQLDALSDSAVTPYAQSVFGYEVDGLGNFVKQSRDNLQGTMLSGDYYPAISEVAQGAGCSMCTGGFGTFRMDYYVSGSANLDDGLVDANTWTSKTTEYLPDNTESDWDDNDLNIVYMNEIGEPMLKVQVDRHGTDSTSDDEAFVTYFRYDDQGRLIWIASPSALATYDATQIPAGGDTNWEGNADLVGYDAVNGTYANINASTGRIDVTAYYTSTTATTTSAGGVAGYEHYEAVKQGYNGTEVELNSRDYIGHADAGGTTIYQINSETNYFDVTGDGTDDAQTTSYSYSWYGTTNRVKAVTTTMPVIATGHNGPGGTTGDQAKVFFDVYGQPIWTSDGDGHVSYTAYDPGTGAVVKHIADVVYSSLTTAEQSSFDNTGWSQPSGGLNLVSTFEVDGLGRTTKETDPAGNVTYTVYNDAEHEVRVYRGWHQDGSNWVTTGPIEVTREFRTATPDSNGNGGVYTETLTTSATPTVSSGVPTGQETISASNIQSLARDLTNTAGQVVEHDDYYSMSGVTYSQTSPRLGSAGNDTGAGGDYHATLYAYDRGKLKRVEEPTGTITRYLYDGRQNLMQTWVGTDDTPTSGYWSPSNTAGTDLVETEERQYNENGDVTQITEDPGGTADPRVSDISYDWRDRPVAVKSGTQATETDGAHRLITYTQYNNIDQPISQETYAGDGVTISDSNSDGVPDRPSSSLLRAKTTTDYDEQGRVYRTKVFSVDPSTGSVSTNALTTNAFYDRRGNVIKTSAPEGLVQKWQYDGAGRVAKAFYSDGGGDSGWGDADDVIGDIVLSQSENTYDADGNPIFVAQRDRFHDDASTDTGELGDPTTSPKARVSYSASYYDAANRLTADVNVGTNGGSSYTRPSSVPSRSDTVLVASYTYDAAGRQDTVTDPRGIVTKSTYDLLGRTTKLVEAYDASVNSGNPSGANNRTTLYTYNGNSAIRTIDAEMPSGTNDQITAYVYGVTTSGGSDINSNDLLTAVHYPDKSTGDSSTLSADRDLFTYNALGQVTSKTDGNGTVHTYGYDVLGRPTSDAITTLGSGVDGSVLRIETSYDDAGRVYQLTSYDASSGGTIVNQLQRAYNGVGQLAAEYQEHGGAVNTSTSPKVQYGYTSLSTSSLSRPTSLTYPNGRVIEYLYDSGLDASISRISFETDLPTGLTHPIERYSYLGLATIVKETHGQSGVDMTYIKQSGESNGDAGDQYTGLDRFGRVVDQRYINTSTSTATDRFQYGYDPDGNVLYKDNKLSSADSELYHASGSSNGYDPLNRLTDFARGTLSDTNTDGVPDTVSTSTRTQNWSLDQLGNWTTLTTDGTGVSRTVNSQNQVTAVGTDSLSYDNSGNTTNDETGQQYVYDAWNRLVAVKDSGGATLETYAYDAAGRRVVEDDGTTARDLYYSKDWQVLEERVGGAAVAQNVWSLGYVDDLVLRDRDADGNAATGGLGKSGSGLEERVYVQHDADHNVTALTDASGAMQERFVYDPYGSVTILSPSWSSTADAYAWVYLHQGGRYDAASGLYDFRNREYSPTLGRWMQRDPAGYVDGSNLYQDERSNPTAFTDPSGLDTYAVDAPDPNSGSDGASSGPTEGVLIDAGWWAQHQQVGFGTDQNGTPVYRLGGASPTAPPADLLQGPFGTINQFATTAGAQTTGNKNPIPPPPGFYGRDSTTARERDRLICQYREAIAREGTRNNLMDAIERLQHITPSPEPPTEPAPAPPAPPPHPESPQWEPIPWEQARHRPPSWLGRWLAKKYGQLIGRSLGGLFGPVGSFIGGQIGGSVGGWAGSQDYPGVQGPYGPPQPNAEEEWNRQHPNQPADCGVIRNWRGGDPASGMNNYGQAP